MKRIGGLLFLVTALVISHDERASANAPPFEATMACAPAAGPGRVRCDAEVRPPSGSRVVWADVVILESPANVTPLKARIPPSDATEARDTAWRWAFAVVAKSHGKSELRARARAVICRGDECTAATRELGATVSAGE